MEKCLVFDPPVGWVDVMGRGLRDWRNKSLKAIVRKLAWSATVYHLWRQRNEIWHGNQPKTEERLRCRGLSGK
jgi:hypothetical protein